MPVYSDFEHSPQPLERGIHALTAQPSGHAVDYQSSLLDHRSLQRRLASTLSHSTYAEMRSSTSSVSLDSLRIPTHFLWTFPSEVMNTVVGSPTTFSWYTTSTLGTVPAT